MTLPNIDKPLIFFDLETTGLDKKKDSIIQFAAIKVDPKTCKIIETKDLLIRSEGNYSISLGAYFKHNISPEMLKDKPTFKEVSQELLDFLSGDFAVGTFNGLSFDLSFLSVEFERIGIEFTLINKDCYDVFLEEKRKFDLTLEGSFKRYFGMTMEEKGLRAHDALSDVKATFMIFVKQQEEHPYGPEEVLTEDNVIKMAEFKGKMLPCFTVGKYRTVPVQVVYQIDKPYLEWILSDACSFSPSCKRFIKEFINNHK